jgi:hypothetical protein
MTPQKIISVIEGYELELAALGVQRKRMDLFRTFGSLSHEEALSHAYYLCDGVKRYAIDPEMRRKTGSHLTSVQISLSLADRYTLAELMEHNRP